MMETVKSFPYDECLSLYRCSRGAEAAEAAAAAAAAVPVVLSRYVISFREAVKNSLENFCEIHIRRKTDHRSRPRYFFFIFPS